MSCCERPSSLKLNDARFNFYVLAVFLAFQGALPPPPPPVETPPLAGVGKSKRKKPGMVKKRIQPIPVHPTGKVLLRPTLY